MKNPGAAENQRLVALLEDALGRENRLWKVPVFKNSCIQGTDITPFQLQDVILWLGEMCRLFNFCQETFALGGCVLNRLLATVKAPPKYLKCIAFTSLILSAKINEEDEVIGSVKGLVVQSGCNFSTAEILRMERIILDKLNWDLYIATPIDFIHIFHALLISGHPHLSSVGAHSQKRPCLQVALWTRQVQHCMACHQLSQFKGSTLALAIITLELERLTPDWFSVFTDLLKKAQIQSTEFIHCKEMVDEYLTSLEFSLPANAVYIFDSTKMTKLQNEVSWEPAGRPGLGQTRRGKGSQGEGDTDKFYDGFRCLYNEGLALEVDGDSDTKILHEAHQKNVSPCPPLHPAVS
ncbi:cyclin-I [Salmo salar]|uniref:Cyclin-I n=1 Tax=Salmo salar TaxID=8030 RepID=B5X2H1_SALSA|nr:cyclin-I [Salmo salar]ACI33502.1 Cyclin-I [Salmo salar]|eukprot:XP_013992283.1 PREDICTED: cyclin-I-like [Salmo salar]